MLDARPASGIYVREYIQKGISTMMEAVLRKGKVRNVVSPAPSLEMREGGRRKGM